MQPSPTDPTPIRTGRLGLLLVVAGTVGLIAAAVLLIEKIELIKDPDYVPTCSINPILSCGSVMNTGQAEAFGFPNPIIGIAGFTAVLTTGVAIHAGATFRRWYWLGLQTGVTFGIGFVHWLIFQSLYRIGALCPYCMAVWIVTIPTFVHVTLHNLRVGHLPTPARLDRAVSMLNNYAGVVITAWYLTITALIARRFWDYWQTLLT